MGRFKKRTILSLRFVLLSSLHVCTDITPINIFYAYREIHPIIVQYYNNTPYKRFESLHILRESLPLRSCRASRLINFFKAFSETSVIINKSNHPMRRTGIRLLHNKRMLRHNTGTAGVGNLQNTYIDQTTTMFLFKLLIAVRPHHTNIATDSNHCHSYRDFRHQINVHLSTKACACVEKNKGIAHIYSISSVPH